MPHAKIATKQATFTLEQLHAELAGKVRESRKETSRLHKAMRHVEAVLKLLQPGYDVRPIAIRRRKPNPWFKRGTVLRHALNAIRQASGPLTARQIAMAMLKGRGVTDPDKADLRTLIGGISSTLQNHRGRDVMRHDDSIPPRWSLTP